MDFLYGFYKLYSYNIISILQQLEIIIHLQHLWGETAMFFCDFGKILGTRYSGSD